MNLFGAQPANEFGAGVYRIAPTFRMGIVIITQLDDSSETMWLKMLGDKQTAQSAFELIKQLSPQLREKNDIIGACIKYCVYLRDIPTDSLTPEDKNFMKTMEQIDAWYEAEMNKARLEGKIEGNIESASTMIRVKFGESVLTPQIASQLSKLNKQQLDDFIAGMFNWQQPREMQEWLSQFI